jgi:hypothetical protein
MCSLEFLCILKAAVHNTIPPEFAKGFVKFSYFLFPEIANFDFTERV